MQAYAADPRNMPARGYIVGLTGGIGSGKSTVAGIFSTLGVALVDTDAIAHALTACGGRAMAAIRSRMGVPFIADDGSLDRSVTRERVFADQHLRRRLEEILHPLIHEEVDILLHSDPVQVAPYALLVVPLLFETLTYRDRTQRTLLVDCPVAAQHSRVTHRSGLSAEETARIVDAQLPRAVRLQLADDVVWNGHGTAPLRSQIEALHLRYVQNANNARRVFAATQ